MRITAARRNAMLDNLAASMNSGFIDIYSGTRPTDADTALAGNTLLASLSFSATAFPAASAGVLTANSINQDATADATGTATFARIFASNHTTALADASVGTSGAEINLNTTSIVQNATVSITSMTVSLPVGS